MRDPASWSFFKTLYILTLTLYITPFLFALVTSMSSNAAGIYQTSGYDSRHDRVDFLTEYLAISCKMAWFTANLWKVAW